MAVKFRFNDAQAGVAAARKAGELSSKVEGICKVIEVKSAEIATLDNTFSANTQCVNRFDQLKATLGEFIEPLNGIASSVKKMAESAANAEEVSKNSMF